MAGKTSDVIVLGGGIAGLTAAGALARQGRAVTLLEARDRLGGRIFTTRAKGWPGPIELGAEFIHEGNRALWKLLRQRRVRAERVPLAHWLFRDGRLQRIADVAAEIGRVTKKIVRRRMRAWSFGDFLRSKRHAFSADERELAAGFVEGFEAAPVHRMSAAAMQGEALDTSEQFSIPLGYARLVDTLVAQLEREDVTLRRRAVVRTVHWHPGGVTVRAGGQTFHARSVIVTLPLGVLQAKRPQRGAVTFDPPLREKAKLIDRMQMGHVVRLTLRFDPRRWPVIVPAELQKEGEGFGFIHSRVQGIPVWWSLSANRVLTGWAGGPAALALMGRSKGVVLQKALRTLSEIFGTPHHALRRAVRDFATHNWSRDPFSRGAYTFTGVGLDDASRRLRQPVDNTVFFAGEATADGDEIGTVHGALASGLRAATEVQRALQRKGREEVDVRPRAPRQVPARRRQQRSTRPG